jgi:hypothetical protein
MFVQYFQDLDALFVNGFTIVTQSSTERRTKILAIGFHVFGELPCKNRRLNGKLSYNLVYMFCFKRLALSARHGVSLTTVYPRPDELSVKLTQSDIVDRVCTSE